MEATMETNQVEVKAIDLEANPEEIQAIARHQEVPNEEAAVETVEALKDQHPAVRHHGRLTCRAIPVLRRG
jgi:hypothetical protein